MNRRGLAVMVLVLSSGCAYSREKFTDEYASESCAALFECDESGAGLFFEDEDQCNSFVSALFNMVPGEEDGCEFDSKAAKDCVADIKSMDCDAMVSGESPSSCDEVFTGSCDIEIDDTGR